MAKRRKSGKRPTSSTRPAPAKTRAAAPTSFRSRFNRFMDRIDFADHLARRLEPRFKTWWVPATLLAFPVLLVILALVLSNFRPG